MTAVTVQYDAEVTEGTATTVNTVSADREMFTELQYFGIVYIEDTVCTDARVQGVYVAVNSLGTDQCFNQQGNKKCVSGQ